MNGMNQQKKMLHSEIFCTFADIFALLQRIVIASHCSFA